MLNRTQSLQLPVLGLALAMFCAESRAGMVSYVVQTDPTGTYSKPNYSQSLNVPAFDSSLGTLTSVSYSISEEVLMSGTLTNNSAGSVPLFTISDTVTWTASFASTSVTNDGNANRSYSNVDKGATVNFGSYDFFEASNPTTVTDPTLLASFQGTTPLSFTYTAMAMVQIGGSGGNAFTNIVTQTSASLTINYFYTPQGVPEPASLAMTVLGGLMATIGWARNRKRSRLAS